MLVDITKIETATLTKNDILFVTVDLAKVHPAQVKPYMRKVKDMLNLVAGHLCKQIILMPSSVSVQVVNISEQQVPSVTESFEYAMQLLK